MVMSGSDAFNAYNAGTLQACSQLNEVTATTVPAGHHRSGVRPAISGSGQPGGMRSCLSPFEDRPVYPDAAEDYG